MAEEQQATITEPWNELATIIASSNADHLEAFIQLLPPGEVAYTISRLGEDDQTKLFELIRPEFAADLMEYLTDEQAADLIEELRPAQAAAIVDELDSDDQADILLELDEEDQQAILAAMDPVEAKDARKLIEYDPLTAGGMMYTEYLAYPVDSRVDDIIDDMRRKAEQYDEYDFHYTYLTDRERHLLGVLPMRLLLLSRPGRQLEQVMVREPVRIRVDARLRELDELFDKHGFSSIPVVDAENRLVGVVAREAVEEAHGEVAQDALAKFGGIIGGEELRTNPLGGRVLRRMMFLVPNIFLSLISISIIALFEPMIQKLTALAVFLPLVANISGASGNQSVAVSIRELSLGLVRPRDAWRVIHRDMLIGAFNGVILGVILGLLVLLLRGETPGLALVVGGAFAINSILSVCFGAVIPLLLKSLKVDPAMASSPLLTTATDAGAFFIVLSIAAAAMHLLVE